MIKVMDFYANWCVPCKTMLPIFEELKSDFTDFEFTKINIEESDETGKYGVTSIPTFIITKNDVEVSRKNGVMSKETFKNWLQSYYDKSTKDLN
jgi:thioredoxin 1